MMHKRIVRHIVNRGCNMTEQALEMRRAYKRDWNRRNRDKVRAAQERYWNRKAAAADSSKADETGNRGQDEKKNDTRTIKQGQ